MFGRVLGVLRLDLIEDRFEDLPTALIQELPQGCLEVERGRGGDRMTEKAGSQRDDLLAQGNAGLARTVEDGLQLLDKSASQSEGEYRRLSHGGCLSHEGWRDRVVPVDTTFVFVRSASFFQTLTSAPARENR